MSSVSRLMTLLFAAVGVSWIAEAAAQDQIVGLYGTWQSVSNSCSKEPAAELNGIRVDVLESGAAHRIRFWDSDFGFGQYSTIAADCSVTTTGSNPLGNPLVGADCKVTIRNKQGNSFDNDGSATFKFEPGSAGSAAKIGIFLSSSVVYQDEAFFEKCSSVALDASPQMPAGPDEDDLYLAGADDLPARLCPKAEISSSSECSSYRLHGKLRPNFRHAIRAESDGFVTYQRQSQVTPFIFNDFVRKRLEAANADGGIRLFDVLFSTFTSEEQSNGTAQPYYDIFESFKTPNPFGIEWPYYFESASYAPLFHDTIEKLKRRREHNALIFNINRDSEKELNAISDNIVELQDKISRFNDTLYTLQSSTALNVQNSNGKQFFDAEQLANWQATGGYNEYLSLSSQLNEARNRYRLAATARTDQLANLSDRQSLLDLKVDTKRFEDELIRHGKLSIPCSASCFVRASYTNPFVPTWLEKGDLVAHTSDGLDDWLIELQMKDAKIALALLSQSKISSKLVLCGGSFGLDEVVIPTLEGPSVDLAATDDLVGGIVEDIGIEGSSEIDLSSVIRSAVWIDRRAARQALAAAEGSGLIQVPIRFAGVATERLLALQQLMDINDSVSVAVAIEREGSAPTLACVGGR